MTSDPANLLIAAICLTTLVLAGGFTQTLVPENGDVRFAVEAGGLCPENQVVRGCVPRNMSGDVWQVQLIEPVLRDLVEVNGTSSTQGSTDPPTGTDTSASTPTETDPGATGARATTAVGGQGPPTSPAATTAVPTDRQAGFDLDAGVRWLLWPLIAVIGAVGTVGVAVALRRGPVETPRDLLRLPRGAGDVLLGFLVGVTARLRTLWASVVGLVVRVSSRGAAPRHPSAAQLPIIGQFLRGLARLPITLVDRLLSPAATDGTPERRQRETIVRERLPDPAADEFDIRRAWAWLARQTTDRRPGSRTPEDIAWAAVDRGYPREAVYELLASFRDVTYGDLPPTDSRRQAARQAYEVLRDAERSSAGGGD